MWFLQVDDWQELILLTTVKLIKMTGKQITPKCIPTSLAGILTLHHIVKWLANTFLCDDFALVFLLTSISSVVKIRVTRATFPARFDSRDQSICFLQGQYQHLSLLIKETDILNRLGLQQYEICTLSCEKWSLFYNDTLHGITQLFLFISVTTTLKVTKIEGFFVGWRNTFTKYHVLTNMKLDVTLK